VTNEREPGMTIRIVPYTAEHEKAVRAFNARLAAKNLNSTLYSTVFPTTHVPAWLPKRSGCDLYQEMFVALDDQSIVRGGYILKHHMFLVNGKSVNISDYQLPISEGIADRRFVNVALSLYADALRRQPYLFGLGGGGYRAPVGKFLLTAGWQTVLVPFWFRIVHPNAFLRDIKVLSSSSLRRGMGDLLRCSGLGWLGVKTIQRVVGKYRHPAPVAYELVGEFSDWIDDVWEKSKDHYSLISVYDRQVLEVLYPPGDAKFKRLKIMRDGKAVGWAVLLNTQMSRHQQFGNMRVGTLVDCLAKPEDAHDVVACSRDFLVDGGADLIVSNQASHVWCRALKDCGFLEGPSNFPFFAAPELAALLKPFNETAQGFHLNRGGGDGPINL
jgi:hypothetical protein